jgi:hypothetical protein
MTDIAGDAEGREVVPMPSELAERFAATKQAADERARWLSPELASRFASMLMLFPVEDGSQATERIVAQVLDATDLDGLNAPWRSENTDAVLGRVLLIEDAKILASQYADGLGAFLYVQALDAGTGEDGSFTTSSTSILAQLATAKAIDLLPIRARVDKSERPSQRGYWPKHLTVLATKASTERVKAGAGGATQ